MPANRRAICTFFAPRARGAGTRRRYHSLSSYPETFHAATTLPHRTPESRSPLIPAILLLIGVDLLGNWIQHRFGLPIPGALIGLILLTIVLCLRPQFATRQLRSGARLLLLGMSMFFVPAGTGVITELHEIQLQWIPIVAALCLSTFASLLVTVWAMQGLDRLLARRSFSRPAAQRTE
jgi:holin-like protein